MSLDTFQSHHIDGGTTVQESPTALIIDLDLGYVFRPIQQCVSGTGFRKGAFQDNFMLGSASPGMASCSRPPFF